MDQFCGSKYWDLTVTWNTTSPDLTDCFQETALTWLPCLFVWLFSPVDFHSIAQSSKTTMPWTVLNITKLLLSLLLIVTSCLELVWGLMLLPNSSPVHYYTPFIKLVTFILVATLNYWHRKRGISTSGVLFFFWLLFFIQAAVNYRSIINQIIFDGCYRGWLNSWTFASRMASGAIIFCQFVLSCFADVSMDNFRPASDSKVQCPKNSASYLSHLTFWWVNPLIILGYKRPLKLADIWETADEIATARNITRFEPNYYGSEKKAIKSQSGSSSSMTVERTDKNSVDGQQKPKKQGIMIPLVKTFWLELLLLALLKLVISLMTFANPNLLDWIISFVTDGNEPVWRGYLYAFLMFFNSMAQSLITNQYSYLSPKNHIRLRVCTINTIYKKSLKLSSLGRKDFTIGEIVNLMSIDTERIITFCDVVNDMWSIPLQIFLAIFMLWGHLGVSTLSGIAIMVILIPVNSFVSAKLRLLHISMMKLKDKRNKLMNEILNGIRVLKMYAWEESFSNTVMDLRKNEIKKLTLRAFLHGIVIFSFSSAQFLVAVASFATFVLIDPKNVLTPNIAFVSLSLFQILGHPLTMLPSLITNTVMFSVSLNRINKYLNGDELDPSAINHDENTNDAVLVNDASFSWSKEDIIPTLKDISIRIKEKKLVAIVGQVGCGKSAILSALLGDMHKNEGTVNVKGKIAYVSQQAWIRNKTLRENILFEKPFDRKKFDKIIDVCCLTPDLEILPGGEMTEIGEKGINLSGGQKQRVSIARACYSDADLYFLDDPLSALDAHVSKQIFDKVIGSRGILKEKTRILVTHRISVLQSVDEIIVMKDGRISEYGTFKELIDRGGDFAVFLIQHLEQHKEDQQGDDLKILEEMVGQIKPEIERQISRTLSQESENSLRRRSPTKQSKEELSEEFKKSPMKGPPHVRFEGRRPDGKGKGDSPGKFKGRPGGGGRGPAGRLTQDEIEETGSVKLSVYLDYFKKIGWLSLFGVILSDLCLNGLNMGSSLWLTAWSDDSLNPNSANDTGLRNLRIGIYGGFGIGQTIFTFLSTVSISLACLKGAKILHNQMLNHMLRAPTWHFDTTPTGRILNRFSKDIDVADTTIGMNIRMTMMRFFGAIVSFTILGTQTPYVLLAILPLAIVYYFIQKLFISTSRQLRRINSNARSPVLGHFSETLSGTSTIKAYDLKNEFTLESNRLVDINSAIIYQHACSNRWLSTRLEFIGYTIILCNALFVVITRDTISPGVAGLTLSYSMQITRILNMLVQATTMLETNIVSVERCLEYTQTPIEAEWFIDETKPKPSWPEKGAIRFDNYSTRYREGLDLVLKKISFDVKPSERIGVVGRTGAGKSSLTLALFRLIEPVEGTIFIDDIDVGKLGLYELRSRLTIIPQDPVLFTGTLRMNLDPFQKYGDDEIWNALELAHLKKFVSTLEEGLDHTVTEGGGNLSVGQKQLVCLSRALLRRSKIIVMDEATAAIDMETDDLIQETIRKEFKNSTFVTIAHRLNTIIDYDRILLLENGQIVEFEKPKALMSDATSKFYSMAKDAKLI